MNEEVLPSLISFTSSSILPINNAPSTSLSPPIQSSSTSDSADSSYHLDKLFVTQIPPQLSQSTGFISRRDHSNSFDIYPRHCYLTTAAKINDISGIVLLDTGSGVTIISSKHWELIGTSDSIIPYHGPEIQGPDGSSIGPVGHVTVQVTLAGVTIQHNAILATHFRHLILLGNDYMKSIGLVLDLQDSKMWLRSHPDRTYPISSDLTQAGRLDIPVVSTEPRIIAPYHIAFIQVNIPHFLSSITWDASITGHRRYVLTANSLVRFTDRTSLVQVMNCSSHQQKLHAGQNVAVADLYLDDVDFTTQSDSFLPLPFSSTTSSHLAKTIPLRSDSFAYLSSFVNVIRSVSISCLFSLPSQRSSTDPRRDLPHSKTSSSISSSFHPSPFISSSSLSKSQSLPSIISTLPSLYKASASSSSPLQTFHSSSHSSNPLRLSIPPSYSSTLSSSALSRSPPLHISINTLSSYDQDFLRDLNIHESDLDSDQISQLQQLLLKYRACFNEKPGRTSIIRHHIDTGDTKPIKLRPYRVSPARQRIISQQIQQMLQDGIIEPANGPYAAPVTLQPKKDGSLRFCVDFRQLNSVTVRDVYPIPRIDDTLDQLQNAKYFTSMDLKSGFWQIELDDDSRSKTAFTTHAGLYNFTVMPFGLTNAPATFQRLMDLVLGGLKWSCALVYLDDIIIYSSTFASHLQHLESVLLRIQRSGLTLHLSKCQFCKTKLRYLGHVVSQSGIEPDPSKIRAVREYPTPTKLKDVRTFLGLTSYYRRFIKNYATIAEPLISLTRTTDHRPFAWSSMCQQSFDHLRSLLSEAPIIAYPQFDKPFILQVDASDVGISAILAQKLIDPDNIKREHVIGYASRTLSSVERRYSATERECLAIVYGCNHFRPYLEGVRFSIITDHKALRWLHTTKDLNSRLARWAMQIAAYDVDIQHRSGADNTNCDALSRAPIDDSPIPIIAPAPLNSLHSPSSTYNDFTPPSSPVLHSILPSTLSLANIHFGDNIHLYDEIRTAQSQDPNLLPLLTYLQDNQLPNDSTSTKLLQLASYHRVIDGALYRVLRIPHSRADDSSSSIRTSTQQPLPESQQLRLVIPKSKVLDLLVLAHDHPTSAHLGRRKTLFRLSTRFYWPHMRRDVESYVRSCNLCQQYKASNKKPGGFMHPIIVNEPWTTVGIDLTGPLPKTRRGNTFILVVVDYFTKWVELFPLANIKASTIARVFLDEVLCRFGFPVRIISDNGVQFLSNVFTNICQTLGIKHQPTPLYHPQSNLSERVNRTIKPLLAALAHDDHTSWDTKLAQIAFALRTAPSDSTEQSPAFLMFGRHPRTGLDLCLPPPIPSDQPTTTTDLSNYRKRLLNDLLPAYMATREILDISHQRQASHYDQHRRSVQFQPGDLVWVTALSGITMGKWRGSKFSPRREGPYRVVDRLSSLTYSLVHPITGKQLTSIHVGRLEPYYSFTTVD